MKPSEPRPIVTWTPAKLARLRKAWQTVKDDPNKVFTFDGLDYLSSYARYLIEYLDGQFPPV